MSHLQAVPDVMPSSCPVCGGLTLQHANSVSVLLAVCDVLVMKALEKMGNYLIRAERSRYHAMAGLPSYVAHSMWPADDRIIDKALKGAWDVVPYILDTHGSLLYTDSAKVTETLDRYVHDLGITGTLHDMHELAYRLRTYLGLPVYIQGHEITEPPRLIPPKEG